MESLNIGSCLIDWGGVWEERLFWGFAAGMIMLYVECKHPVQSYKLLIDLLIVRAS